MGSEIAHTSKLFLKMSLGSLSQAANVLSTQLRLEGALMRPAGVISCSVSAKDDPCVMAVYREHGPDNDNINVGHIPIELSSTLCLFVKHGGKVPLK